MKKSVLFATILAAIVSFIIATMLNFSSLFHQEVHKLDKAVVDAAAYNIVTIPEIQEEEVIEIKNEKEEVIAEVTIKEETTSTAKENKKALPAYNANRMTHYVMDGKNANKCIAGRWCIGNQLSIADDTSIRYKENGKSYYVWAVHCSVVKEWRGSIIKVYYKDGGVETGIVLDCGGFAGHKDRMDKAMGKRYNGKQDNYTLSRYIKKTEVIRKGW